MRRDDHPSAADYQGLLDMFGGRETDASAQEQARAHDTRAPDGTTGAWTQTVGQDRRAADQQRRGQE
jgi:hypothetical protein